MKIFILFIVIANVNSLELYQLSEQDANLKGLGPLFNLARNLLVPSNISKYFEYSEQFSETEDYRNCLNKSPDSKYYDERKIIKKVKHTIDNYNWKDSYWVNFENLNNFDKFIEPTKLPEFIKNLNWFLDTFSDPFYNSGKFYYPPKGVREWHTNAYQGGPGWRMYVIIRDSEGDSGMNIIDPNTKEFLNIKDLGTASINFFKITDNNNPTWHCVYSKNVNRYSMGLKLTDDEINKLI